MREYGSRRTRGGREENEEENEEKMRRKRGEKENFRQHICGFGTRWFIGKNFVDNSGSN